MKQLHIDQNILERMLRIYLDNKPAFLSVIRAKESSMFHSLVPYKRPCLDFGCGDGFFTKLSLIDKAQKLDIGLETNYQRAALARKSGVYNRVIIYDGQVIPLKDETIATVVSNSVLEHIANINRSILEIYRILKKGGVFYVSVMVEAYEENLLGTLLLGALYKTWVKKRAYHAHVFSPKQWETLFKESGFTIERKLGYLDKQSARLLDLLQYISIPSIITQKRLPTISKIYNRLMRILFERRIKRVILKEKQEKSSSAFFYILRK